VFYIIYKISVGKPEGKDTLIDIGIDGRTVYDES
jgi:hypothetical protein